MTLTNESAARTWFKALPEWNDEALDRLEDLAVLLTAENDVQNLVSDASLAELWVRHYADSAQLLNFVPRETCRSWLDLGTGAGFPGLVIAALRPECEIHMVESRGRRIEWLQRAADSLHLSNAHICGTKVEALETRKFDAISARAFAPLPKLLDLSARFSTDKTIWLLPKGRSARQELKELQGWNHLFHVEQSITDTEAGVIVGTLNGRKGRKA
ncbi:16S rRNA (guanine(527)-N(7))-methyltransferase RsmG [Novosphingobium sp.]|uniref:16S rRNA (guanine(527)-N(7))-methyltransferase RsmG n=1 Tax=Novosphingobium sp. TaxID=1874826 RepID=UPI0035AD8C84